MTPALWLGIAVGLVLVLVGGYVVFLEARVRALEEARGESEVEEGEVEA